MKKLLFAAVAVAMLSMTACEKDYTCTCTTSDSSGLIPSVTSSTTITGKKKDAEDACDGTSVSVGTITTTCELD